MRFPLFLMLALVLIPRIPAAEPAPLFVYVSGSAPDIACFRLDPTTGTLTPAGTYPGGSEPSYLAWAPDRRTLYAINRGAKESRVRSYRIDPGNGALTFLDEVPSGGQGICHLSVHPSGRWVYTAHYGSGHLGVLPVLAEGRLGPPIATPLAGSKAHQAVTDRTGRFLYVPCLGVDQVVIYAIESADGRLRPCPPAALPPKAGPRHLAFAPDGRHAYVLNELASSLTTFAVDAADGSFRDPQTVSILPPEFTKTNTAAHVVVAPDGRTVYASNRGHDSLAILRLDPVTGMPMLAGHAMAAGDIRRPRDFTLDPSGSIALVANQDGDSLTVLRVDPLQGGLERRETIPVGRAPQFVGVMPAP